MGRLFGSELAVVNLAFVMAYTFANVVAPPASGLATGIIGADGLMMVVLVVAASFMLLVLIRRREFYCRFLPVLSQRVTWSRCRPKRSSTRPRL